MAHLIENRDNFIYVKMTSSKFEFNNEFNFLKSISEIQTANPNLIINCANIEEIDDKTLFKIKRLYRTNKKLAGHIIVSEIKEELATLLESIEINCIPTDDEAIDYIFMEQLEQEFLKEFDED